MLVAALFVALSAVFIGTALAPAPTTASIPLNDVEIRAHFQANKGDFLTLVHMIEDDLPIRAISADHIGFRVEFPQYAGQSRWRARDRWCNQDGQECLNESAFLAQAGLAVAKWHEYQERLRSTRTIRLLKDPVWLGGRSVEFVLISEGNVVNSRTTGIVYLRDGLPSGASTCESTDQVADESSCFLPLEEGWFIYAERS